MAEKQTVKPSERAGGFTHKVGSTAYTVNVFYGTSKGESFEDKILRMMKNDLKEPGKGAILSLPQADRLPETEAV